MSILFISSLVPETSAYYNRAFSRSGQNVMKGLADSFAEVTAAEFVSCQPVQSFPKGKFFLRSHKAKTDSGYQIHFLPTINIMFLKNIIWGMCAVFYILKWARSYKDQPRHIIVYNIYIPIISLVYHAARLSKSKIYVVLYDLGIPPKHLNLGALKMFGYSQFEKLAYKYIPKLDGRIVINERIIDEYAPHKDYILIDGGINDQVLQRLFPLKVSQDIVVTYVLAGMLWEQNGTQLVLDALKIRPDMNVKVIFAGNGNDVSKILKAANSDSRIEYVGMLTMDELFKVYEKADVLLNLRIEEDNDMHFPSKLLEYMSVGKWVLSTPIAHAERDYSEYVDFLHVITPDGLVAKVEEISRRSKFELYEVGNNMRQYMIENRTWRKRTQEILNYLNK